MKKIIAIVGSERFAESALEKIKEEVSLPLLKTYSSRNSNIFVEKVDSIKLNKMNQDNKLFYHEWMSTTAGNSEVIGVPNSILDGNCIIKLSTKQVIELLSFRQKSLYIFASSTLNKKELSELTDLASFFNIYILDENNVDGDTIKYVLKES